MKRKPPTKRRARPSTAPPSAVVLGGRIVQILRAHLPADSIIDVSPSGVRDNLHVLVVSRSLDELTESAKQELLWDHLERGGLTRAELGRISMILPLSVAELRR